MEVSERLSVEVPTAYERGTWFNKIRRLITAKNAYNATEKVVRRFQNALVLSCQLLMSTVRGLIKYED